MHARILPGRGSGGRSGTWDNGSARRSCARRLSAGRSVSKSSMMPCIVSWGVWPGRTASAMLTTPCAVITPGTTSSVPAAWKSTSLTASSSTRLSRWYCTPHHEDHRHPRASRAAVPVAGRRRPAGMVRLPSRARRRPRHHAGQRQAHAIQLAQGALHARRAAEGHGRAGRGRAGRVHPHAVLRLSPRPRAGAAAGARGQRRDRGHDEAMAGPLRARRRSGVLRDGTDRPQLARNARSAPHHPATAEQLPAPPVLRHRGRQREGAALPARRGGRRPRGPRQRLALRAVAPLARRLGAGLEDSDPGREGQDPVAESRVAADAVMPFLTASQAAEVRGRFGTPCYVYDRAALERTASRLLALKAPYGFTLRYAMKANPSGEILVLFRDLGLHIDASSDWEVARARRPGFGPARIQLSAQMPSTRLAEHIRDGVLLNACSLHQLEAIGRAAPGHSIAVRMNPGLGSGSTKRTNTGGPSASFGIWHEYLDDVKSLAARHRLTLRTLHTHIGSGTDPDVWQRVTRMTLDLAEQLPDVAIVNLGGGFKVGRMPEEPTADLDDVAAHVRRELDAFRPRHGRSLHLEIEPGTYLVAQAGAVVATCIDVVDTGKDGYLFAKLDTGMTEVMRPSLYGAQHPIDVMATGREAAEVVFVGPCCESGDILTPAPGDPEGLGPRWVSRPRVGDLVIVGGAGAYCAAMSTINYNSYPQAPEVMLDSDGTLRLVRRRQSLDQMLENELGPS